MRKVAVSCAVVVFVGCAVSQRTPDKTEEAPPYAAVLPSPTPPPTPAVAAQLKGMIDSYQAALTKGFTTDRTTSRIIGDANTPDYRVQAQLAARSTGRYHPDITCNTTQSFNVATGGPIHATPGAFSAWNSCATTDLIALGVDSTTTGRGIAGTSLTPNDASAASSGLIVLTNVHSGGAPQLQSYASTTSLPLAQSFHFSGVLFNLAGTRIYALSQQGNLYCFNLPATTTPATAMTACTGSWPYSAGTTVTWSSPFPTYGTDIKNLYFGDDTGHLHCVQGETGASPGTRCSGWGSSATMVAGGDASEPVGPPTVNIDSTTGKETIYVGDDSGRFFRITNNGSTPAAGGDIERKDLCTILGGTAPCAKAPWAARGAPAIDYTHSLTYMASGGYLFEFPLTREQNGGNWGGGTATYKNLNTLYTTSTQIEGSTTLDYTGYAYVGFANRLFKAAFPFDGNTTDKIYATLLNQAVSGSDNFPRGYALPYYNSMYIGTGTNSSSPTSGIIEQYTSNSVAAPPPLAAISKAASSPPPFGSLIETGEVIDWKNGNLYFGYDTAGTSGGIVQYPAANPDPASSWACPTGTTSTGGVCIAGCATAASCTLGTNVATESCVSGACKVATCVANYADCDGNNTNGCEVNFKTDPNNCGACSGSGGTVCPSVNDTPTCVNGACSVTCNSGYGVCSPGNINTAGCPTMISCTSCCGTGPSGSNTCSGGTSCVGGACTAGTQHVCDSENEDYTGSNPVVLTCPTGALIQGIAFASFGTPNGSCGSFSKGACDDANGSSGNNNEGLVVSNACYGKASCSVDPINSVFGDPCSGTYKHMAIQVECACGPVLSLCANGLSDGAETDVDCGGAAETGCSNSGSLATRCAPGKVCAANSDCASGTCTSKVCVGLVDGSACTLDSACTSGNCAGGTCQAIAFSDAAQAGNQAWTASLGLDFVVAAGKYVTVTEMGVFDDNANGISATGNLTSAIYVQGTKALVAGTTTTFTSSTTTKLVRGDRFVTLATPVVLGPGSYTIVAWGFTTNDKNLNLSLGSGTADTTDSNGAALTFSGQARFNNTATGYPADNTYTTIPNVFGAGTFAYSAGTQGANGATCTAAGQCTSGFCVGGLCTATGPVATYSLAEGTGTTTADGTGNGHTGTLNGSVTWAPTGQGLSFPGTADGSSFLQATTFTDLGTSATPFSLALWARPVTSAGVLVNVSDHADGSNWCMPFLGFTSGGNVAAQIWNGSSVTNAISPSAVTAGSWTHVVMTYSTTNGIRLYLNGTLVKSQAGTYSASGVADYLDWGSNQNKSGACSQGAVTPGYYSGLMDYLGVYKVELTAGQVTSLAGKAPKGATCSTGAQCVSGTCTSSACN